jgi:RimJ/RimL family protein N-acetyltransferase
MAWRNQESIRKWFINTNLIDENQHLAWFRRYLERDDDFLFIIEDKARGNRPVGQISIYQVDRQNLSAEYGRIMIGDEEARGKGLAKAATNLVLEFAFETLGLQVITLEVRNENEPALAIYNSCGFQVTGEKNGLIYMSLDRQGGHNVTVG